MGGFEIKFSFVLIQSFTAYLSPQKTTIATARKPTPCFCDYFQINLACLVLQGAHHGLARAPVGEALPILSLPLARRNLPISLQGLETH